MKIKLLVMAIALFVASTKTVYASHLDDEKLAKDAYDAAARFFDGKPYSWEEGRYCSSLAAKYAENLGVVVSWNNTDPGMPWSNTVAQVKWIQSAYPDYSKMVELAPLAGESFWTSVPIGSLVYLQTDISHNGFDTYSHVVIFMGRIAEKAVFAEYASFMKYGPQDGRTLKNIMQPYYDFGTYDFSASLPDNTLKAFIFDLIGATSQIRYAETENKIWRIRNSEIIAR